MDARDRLSALLPTPKRLEVHAGCCSIDRAIRVDVGVSDVRITSACERWVDRLASANERQADGDSPKPRKSDTGTLTLRVRCEPTATVADANPQAYRLTITPDQIEVVARDSVGCFYGLQTLDRLTTREGTAQVACCTIDDRPDFATRGLLLDVTRGRVPTLDRLKKLVDRLTSLKINQLQLYIEHAFVFTFDPDICEVDDGLTPDEIRALDSYCHERFIELVPAVATFGHMGRILSSPRYQSLAEIAPTTSWEAMEWPKRARGFTLDCTNPKAHRLVERIWSDLLNAFSSPVVNICGDEPWDLGRGRNAGRWDDRGRGIAYLEHIRRTHDVCAARGRRAMFWSDVVTNYPDLFDRVPRDATVLHWGYDDQADYAATGAFTEAGLTTIVCPGTSGWKRIINAMDLAERNISTFARTGKERGATGLINTDWGDHGHFNMPACSWHGVALGASLAWRADHEIGTAFDESFARSEWGLPNSDVVRALRDASAIATKCETWRMLWMPVERIASEDRIPDTNALSNMRDSAQHALQLTQSLVGRTNTQHHGLDELALACRMSELCARKLLACRRSADGIDVGARDDLALHRWSDEIEAYCGDYAIAWNRGDKPSGLSDILRAMRTAATNLTRTFLS